MDFVLNGQANGSVANTLLANGFNVNALRPWVGKDQRSYIAHNQNGKMVAVPTQNANATLRHEEWMLLDQAVIMAAQARLRVVADLRGAGLVLNIPNGMGKTVLETQNMSDITPAIISMDPARKSEGDRPEFDLTNLPLPIIHKDFFFNARQIATSRNFGPSIDVSVAELAARKVAEEAEKLVLGVSDNNNFTFGGGVVYGLTNFPSRLTKVITAPTNPSWTPQIFLSEVLAMRQQSVNAHHFGPWVMYVSPSWDAYLDEDYSDKKGDWSVRTRVKQVNGLTDIRTADFLPGFQVILVQQTSDVIREVIGMDITTLQWETNGGMTLNFKVMAMLVPQLRADFNGNTGIVHGNVA